jgi:uncharacterized protein YjiS (DUF1127 family)
MSVHSITTMPRPLPRPIGFLGRVVGKLLLWQVRSRERHALGSMDDHMLKDIGLNRADVSREAGKPFWRV